MTRSTSPRGASRAPTAFFGKRPASRALAFAAVLFALAGCDVDDSDENPLPDDDEGPGSACGEPVTGIELDFTGTVTDGSGNGIGGVDITLLDYSFTPPTQLGAATSGANGIYAFKGRDITSLPNCWLTVLDYRVTAAQGDKQDEVQANRDMWNTIKAEETLVEVDTLVLP